LGSIFIVLFAISLDCVSFVRLVAGDSDCCTVECLLLDMLHIDCFYPTTHLLRFYHSRRQNFFQTCHFPTTLACPFWHQRFVPFVRHYHSTSTTLVPDTPFLHMTPLVSPHHSLHTPPPPTLPSNPVKCDFDSIGRPFLRC